MLEKCSYISSQNFNRFEETRDLVKSYINAKHREIIFTKDYGSNNLVATYGEKFIKQEINSFNRTRAYSNYGHGII